MKSIFNIQILNMQFLHMMFWNKWHSIAMGVMEIVT